MPALPQGLFDRALVIGWAFRYPRYFPFVGDTTVTQVTGRTMEFCGLSPVRVTRFADVRNASDEQRARWWEDARRLGAADAGYFGGIRIPPSTRTVSPFM